MPIWLAPAIMGAVSLAQALISGRQQKKENRRVAEFQKTANEEYLAKQNAYNTPAAQMQRFQDARLNPNLIYGQGNPGSQSQALSAPELKPVDYQGLGQGVLAQILPLINQTKLANSQVNAQDANVRRLSILNDLTKMQTAVLARNPMLNEEAFNATISALKSTAEIKASESSVAGMEAEFKTGVKKWTITESDGTKREITGPPGAWKLQRELDILDQRFNLLNADSKIKAEIWQSKEFQNQILEVQKNWMTDQDITPQHIYQFIILLLTKML